VRRSLAYPLAIGADVPLLGRVKECVKLIEPGRRLLDVGCSSGWLSEYVMNMGFDSYVGLDRVIIGSQGATPATTFVVGSAFSLPFDDKSFDAACMFDVIEHLPRGTEHKALREAHRVLRIGGRLYFSTPHASLVLTPLDPVWILGHRHYRRATIRRLLASAGFTHERMFVAGGAVESLDHIRLLVYKHLLHRPLPPIDLVAKLIEKSHARTRRLGATIFAVASKFEVPNRLTQT
jgi:SAM-dependent methyltransferase